MTRYTITPWRSQADLLQVRQQLYSSNAQGTDLQRRAVNRVMAWKLRGNLPHAVESTALLVDAILHHDPSANSSFSIRAVYSAAFCRFVTGFCDIGRHRERALEPSSMLDIAKQIDMPVEFVALRHEATHEELPGLQRLKGATQRALDWLWTVYWSRISSVEGAEAPEPTSGSCKSEVGAVLRGYRKAARGGLLSKKRADEESAAHVHEAYEALAAACQDGWQLVTTLTELMVGDGLLLPADRVLGSSLDGSYLLWDPLIAEIQSRLHVDFMCEFSLALLQGLDGASTCNLETDPDKEALAQWVLHLLSSSKSDSANESQLFAEVMKHCCLYPGYWTQKVAEEALAMGSKAFRDQWSDLFDASLVAENASNIGPRASDGQMEEKSGWGSNAEVTDGLIEDEPIDAWTRTILAPRTPIGVV